MRGQVRLLVGIFAAALAVGVGLYLSRSPDSGMAMVPSPGATRAMAETVAPPTATVTSESLAVPSSTTNAQVTTATATPTKTFTPTLAETSTIAPAPPTSPPITPWPTTSSRRGGLVVGGVDLASMSSPLSITYPTDWERTNWLELEEVGILLSDSTGENLRIFDDIGSWRPGHRIFVYADGPTGVPILSIHDGYWARQPLEAEPLRAMIEGPVASPHGLDTIKENLERLRGHPMIFQQDGAEARFVVRRALRMDAATTSAYLYRPAYLSELFPEGEVTQDAVIILICSARQPGEPDEVFPGRFLILLGLEAG